MKKVIDLNYNFLNKIHGNVLEIYLWHDNINTNTNKNQSKYIGLNN